MFSPDSLKAFKKDFGMRALTEDDLIMPKAYISTGNYAVNKIISGSMFKGIPNNRITTFYGESGCVPFSAKVYILCKTDVEIAEVLEYVREDSIFQNFFEHTTIEQRVNLLCEIGYTVTEICKRLGITRQAMYYGIKNNTGEKLKSARTTSARLNTLLKKNVFQVPIQGLKLLNYRKIPYLLLTPYGFRRAGKVIDKGEKETFVLSVVDCPTTPLSKDHLVEMEDGKFEFVENLYRDHRLLGTLNRKIKTIYGPRDLVSIREGGYERVCDIEVQDPHHSYFANDMAGHNSGKSLIVSEIVINAIKTGNYDAVFYLDSEGGMLSDRFTTALTDDERSKIYHIMVDSIEDCTYKLHSIYDDIQKQYKDAKGDASKEPHVMVVLDSFSGLQPKAFKDKALQDNVTGDMGQAAKGKNAMIKSLMVPVVTTCCPLVIICHAYASMNAMGPQKFKEMSGGEGIKYASHIVVQSSKSRKRQEDSDKGLKGGGSYYAGNAIRYITYKDRLVKEGLETTMYVDLNEGISKYAGLWDDAVRLGFIKQLGSWYQVPSWKEPEKKFRRDEIAENDEIWNTFLKDMDKIFQVETAYGNKEFSSTNIDDEEFE